MCPSVESIDDNLKAEAGSLFRKKSAGFDSLVKGTADVEAETLVLPVDVHDEVCDG